MLIFGGYGLKTPNKECFPQTLRGNSSAKTQSAQHPGTWSLGEFGTGPHATRCCCWWCLLALRARLLHLARGRPVRHGSPSTSHAQRVQVPESKGTGSQMLYLEWVWGPYTITFAYLDPQAYPSYHRPPTGWGRP